MRDLLRGLFRRAESAGPAGGRGGWTLGGSNVASWARGDLERLVALGVLREAPRALEAERPGCDLGCLVRAEFERDPASGRDVCVHRCVHGCGRAVIGAEIFDRWEFDLAGLARALAVCLESAGECVEVVPGRIVCIGTVGDSALSREAFVCLGLGWRDFRGVLADAPRLVESRDPLVLCVGARPPASAWPDAMAPAWAVLAEHVEVSGRGLALDLSKVLGQEVVPHPRAKSARWLAHKDAALLLQKVIFNLTLAKAKARVSAAKARGAFKTNASKGRGLLIDAASFHLWIEAQRERENRRSDEQALGRNPKRPRASRGWGGPRA